MTTRKRFLVLIVDDEPDMRHMLSFGLDPDFEVLEAEDGMRALEFLENRKFNLVLTDMRMPRMDGMELLRTAKKKHPGVKVVIMTGFGTEEMEALAMREGAYAFIRKPFNLDQLCAILGKALAEIKSS